MWKARDVKVMMRIVCMKKERNATEKRKVAGEKSEERILDR